MIKHGVTWERLRNDFTATAEYQISSFRELHGKDLDAFTSEVESLVGQFSLFNTHYSLEDTYGAFCHYLEGRVQELRSEIGKRKK